MNNPVDSIASSFVEAWQFDRHIENLPAKVEDLDQAYMVQERFTSMRGVQTCGWKIAATNIAGQKHINVTHPLAGRLFVDRIYQSPAQLLLRANRMKVIEAEFTFRIGSEFNPGDRKLSRDQVMERVDGLFPAIEIPDSRFIDFVSAGAPALVADNACAREFVLGPEVTGRWREIALERYDVFVFRNGEKVVQGQGRDVLGDPRDALTWLVNDRLDRGIALQAGELVTTGVVGTPVAINAGDQILADFGLLGKVSLRFADLPDQ